VAAGLGSAPEHALISLLALSGLRISEALSADITAMASERGHRTLTVLRHPGCSPADSPADPSAPTNSQNTCGIRPAQARSTALFSLATELSAAILARLLGIRLREGQQHLRPRGPRAATASASRWWSSSF
jgi:integrase